MNKRIEKTIINPPNLDRTRTLKPAEQILTPDPSWGFWKRRDLESGEYRHTKFEDIYRQAELAKLDASVPSSVREHFATALNLVAYSWFYYPFATQAELAAYTSVEKALKIRFGCAWGKPSSFSRLLSRAIDEGLLTEAGFSHMARLPPIRPIDGEFSSRLDLVKRMLLDARNTMAHGDPRLRPDGAFFVIICAELINQLFSPSLHQTAAPCSE